MNGEGDERLRGFLQRFRKEGMESSTLSPQPDIFCTPANTSFYNSRPYQPLDVTRKEIRLVRLHMNAPDDPIQCDLVQNVSLADSDHLQYYAVSYCAGDPNMTMPMVVDNVSFNAFSGVASMLCAIRLYYRTILNQGREELPPLLWIDQICINQSDLAERSQQVSSMRDIYQSANELLVWLGSVENEMYNGLRLISIIVKWYKERCRPAPGSNTKTIPVSLFVEEIADKMNSDLEWAERFGRWWGGFRDILQSPYWTRAWIVQELLCCKKRMLLCGVAAVAWETFETGFALISLIHTRLHEILERSVQIDDVENVLSSLHQFNIQETKDLISLRKNWEASPNFDLKAVLDRLRSFKSTDPRDRVYSVIGLVSPEYGLVPDYRACNTMEDVLVDAALRIMVMDQNLEILRFVQHQTEGSSLPSWVPQWNPRGEDVGCFVRGRLFLSVDLEMWRRQQHAASGSITSVDIDVIQQSTYPEFILCAEAIILGHVAEPDTLEGEEALDFPKSAHALAAKWRKIASARSSNAIFDEDDCNKSIIHMLVELLGNDLAESTGLLTARDAEQVRVSADEDDSCLEELDYRTPRLIWPKIGQRRFFSSPDGQIGLAPLPVLPDDVLCILLGCSEPCVLRKAGDVYRFIGLAYIHGMMNGEAVKLVEEGKLKMQKILLI